MKTSYSKKAFFSLGAGILTAFSPAWGIDLANYQWENRILMVFSPAPFHAEFTAFERQLTENAAGVRDRDLVVFRVFEAGESRLEDRPLPAAEADELRRRFKAEPGRLTVILIGKDGGVKMTRERHADLQEIFDRIDSMPMRRQEMREKDQNR